MPAPEPNWDPSGSGGGDGRIAANGDYGTVAPDTSGGIEMSPAGDGADVQQKPTMMDKKPVRRIGAKPPPDRAPRSIYCFSVKNIFRKKCIEFVEWKPFEFLILFTILGNCVALAVYTPFPAEDTNEMNLILVSFVTKMDVDVGKFRGFSYLVLLLMSITKYITKTYSIFYRNKSNIYF